MAEMTMPCGRKFTVSEGMKHIPKCSRCSAWVVANVRPRERKEDSDEDGGELATFS